MRTATVQRFQLAWVGSPLGSGASIDDDDDDDVCALEIHCSQKVFFR